MYQPGELEIVIGKALARWSAETGFREALPPVWLRELAEMVRGYSDRLLELGLLNKEVFEEDVYLMITSKAVGFLRKVG